jgi:hypothetical protein
MIFTFWVHDTARSGEGEDTLQSVAAWREHYPSMTAYSDVDVIPLLEDFGSAYVDLYNRIRIPACKSDLARLLLLFRFGGLYVDSHIGPSDGHDLVGIFGRLATYEVVLIDETSEHATPTDIYIMNGVICARKASLVIKVLIESALLNLQEHERLEHESKSFVPYNIFVLTGAWDILTSLFEFRDGRQVIKPEFADKVYLVGVKRDEDHGFVLYKHYSYRGEGQHWSERQNSEPLFSPRTLEGVCRVT